MSRRLTRINTDKKGSIMAVSDNVDGVRCYLDPQGLMVPYRYVSKGDRDRDKTVNMVFTRAFRIHRNTKKEKAEIAKIIDSYLERVAEKYNEEWKGNATIYDFSHTLKIEINVNERVDFDEKLQVARQKIGECFSMWSKGSKTGAHKLKTIVDDAFKTDKKGNVNARKLLGLRRHKFDDEPWREAMDLIADSIIIVGSRVYYRFWYKPDQDQSRGWEPLEVNFSAIGVNTSLI
jgi:polysaccharide pyruvyl transferase WcaK-like protein